MTPAKSNNARYTLDKTIQEQARMLSTLMGNLDGMVYRCRDDADWTMEFVSDGCTRLTGYKPEDLLSNAAISYESITYPEDRQRVRNTIREALAAKKRFDVEYRITRLDGSIRWVWERGTGVFDADGELDGVEGFIQDVTDRRRAEQAQQTAEQRYRNIFENAIEGIFQSTVDGHYVDVNPALAKIYGYASARQLIDSLGNIGHQLYVDPQRRQDFLICMNTTGLVANFESQVYRRDGEIIWISENARAVRDENGGILYFEGTVEDITERKRYETELAHQATHDELTGLPNRTLLRDRIRQAISFAVRRRSLLAVAFLDLDHFKMVNDSIGHLAGDTLLKSVADRLRLCIRDCDTVARQGGDEFVILLTDQSDLKAISETFARILATVSKPWQFRNFDFNISCSIGVSIFPSDGADEESLLKNADVAMYKAKELGRNNLRFFTSDLSQDLTARLALESNLRRAVEKQELLLYYQPRIDLETNRLTGAEALIRWQTEAGELVPPNRFIPIAEQTGLILPIGRWVLETACAQLKSWQDRGLSIASISINISPVQFHDSALKEHIFKVLAQTGLNPESVELELTENLAMHDTEKFISVLRSLRELGVKIAIDDFGTGYSSLIYLKRLPVDRLKIDQSFVRDISADAEDAAIARTIIELGHILNLRVVAEGVETGEQLEFLRQNGCDEVQGYYYSKPLPAGEFERLLEDGCRAA